jgi:ParB family transcriptional regulator, chromosome partitioning protein
LSSLIPGAAGDRGLIDVPVDAVAPNPRQPRRTFEPEALAALAHSIGEVGVLQPVVVRRHDGGYELVAGERRLRAARLAGLATIPAVVRQGANGDALREALIENIHRQDLAPLELAAAFQELLEELGATQEAVADHLGCSRAHVANTIRLLSLPASVQRLLAEDRIQAGHARALLGLPDDDARSAVALRAAAEGLSVRAVEDLVRTYVQGGRRLVRAARRPADPSMREVEAILSEHLSTRVQVTAGRRKGRIVIEFADRDDLERLVDEIVPEPARRAAG